MTIDEIGALIADHITKHRKAHPESAVELRFQCPVHHDEHPSARWHLKNHVWICDACKQGGGAVELAKLLDLDIGQNGRAERKKRAPNKSSNKKITATYDYRDE